jgi:hypothetical protein
LIDFLLNMSFLMLILGGELLVTGLVALFDRDGIAWRWVVVPLAGWVISWGITYLTYQAAVSSTRTMGVLTNMCWDFFRDKLASKYGLTRPDSLLEEQKMWLRLGRFLRTGEKSYFPKEYKPKPKSDMGEDKKGEG